MGQFNHSDLRRLVGTRASVPIVLQTEATECANACLAMIAGYYGLPLTIYQLRRRFPISLKGIALTQIVRMCAQVGLQHRAVTLDLSELGNLRTPCILHWNFNHFVVLCATDQRSAIIHDPALGRRRISHTELSKSFTGVALEVWPSETFQTKPAEASVRLRELVGKIYGLKRSLLQVLLLALVLEIFSLIVPFFTQWVVDDVIISADLDLLATLIIGFTLLMIMQTAVSAVRSYVGIHLGTSISFQSKTNLFAHLVKLPTAFFERRHVGDIVSRFGSIDTIQQTLNSSLIAGVLDGIMTTITLGLMLVYSPALASIAIAAMALYGLIRMAGYRRLRDLSHDAIIKGAKTQSHFLETIRGIRTIQIFQQTLERREVWQGLLADQVNASVRVQKLKILFQQFNSLLFGLEGVIILWFGAKLVIEGHFTVGMLMAFLAYKGQFNGRVAALIDNAFELRMLRLQGDRLSDIVLTPPEADGVDQERSLNQLSGSLAFSGVYYRYGHAEAMVLEDVSFDISQGESVAIVGATGSGKSTLLKLMLGVLSPIKGEILLGGVSYPILGPRGVRTLSTAVLQDDVLFAGSIAENVSFFDGDADSAWIEECCKHAAIHDEIAALPMGYNTLVGDMGTVLSGGQKQRVLIARALYRRPKILFLDEATCHLDLEVEARVVAMLKTLRITRIVVAHRPQTIASADRVLRVRKGRIEEVSTVVDGMAA